MSQNVQTTRLMAFLLWNATRAFSIGLYSKAQTSAQRLGAYWRATREQYVELVIRTRLTNVSVQGFGGAMFELVVVIFIIGALIGPVANVTTGITIAHTGFTPNPNITQSPGAAPLAQLFPLVLIAIGLIGAFEWFKRKD